MNQNNAHDTNDSIVAVISDVAEAIRLGVRKFSASTDTTYAKAFSQLTITQLHYLHRIEACNGITGTELSKEFNVAKPTITNAISRLVEHGYVRKQTSSRDKRVSFLFLTKEGQRVLAVERQGYYDYAKKVLENLSEEEAEQLCKLFGKLF